MPIQIQCVSCGRRGKVKDEYAGRRIRCPDCQEPISVPAVEDDFDGDYADYEVDYEEEEFDERPSPARTRRRQGRRGRARSRRKPRAERGWLRRHWHWMAALVMMLFALWPKQGLVIIALFGAVGVLMVFIGGLFPFVRIIYGAPGTVLLLLLSRSARFDMLYQPDHHPYKVLCRTAFDPTRGLFWKGVLLVVMCIPAGIINKAIPEFASGRDPDPVPQFAGRDQPHLTRPGQRGVDAPAPNRNAVWPGVPGPGNPAIGGGDEPPSGFRRHEPAGFQAQRVSPRVFSYTITYESYTGAGPADEVALSALRINSGFPEDTLEVDEEARTITFQYRARIEPDALSWLFESRGFRGLTVQRSGD